MEEKSLDQKQKMKSEKTTTLKSNRIIFFKGVVGVFIVVLFFCFIKALHHKIIYDEEKTLYRMAHHLNSTMDENPIKIVSEFRGDSMKRGVAVGVFDLRGRVRPLFTKINGSLHTASKSTPAVDKSGIYVGSDNGWFYKLNHQGQLVWKTYFAKAVQGMHGTALLSEKYLWIGAYDGVLYCLNKKTGKLMWSIDLGDAIGSSPSFYKGQIIVSVELIYPRAMGYVASVSAKDGSLNWKSPLTLKHIHSSVAIHTKKEYGVTGSNNGSLFKIDLNSGRYLWSLQMKGDIKSTPLIYKDQIYVSNWGDQFAAVSEDGKLIWELDIKNYSQSSPTYVPDRGYLIFSTSKGQLFAVSARTDAIIWMKNITNRRATSSGVSFFSKRHRKYLFLFPCTEKAVCIIDPANGNYLKTIQTGFLLTGSFAFFNNSFYMSFDNGGVQALY